MFDAYQAKIKEKLPPQVLQTIRITQFLAAVISIILYIVHVVRKTTTNSSDGAILGICAGAIIWTVIAFAKACFAKHKAIVGIIAAVILDLAFVAAYIAVAVLTRGSLSGSCGKRNSNDSNNKRDNEGDSSNPTATPASCNILKGVFALAIINICQHLASSAMEHLHTPPGSMKHPMRSGNIAG